MCISYSDDLSTWSDSQILMVPRPGCWDSHKIGGGAVRSAPPKAGSPSITASTAPATAISTGSASCSSTSKTPPGSSPGAALPVLWPESPYEMLGRVANVTFTCNAIPEPDGTVKIYYGAADTCVGLATARLDDLVAACKTGNPTAERFFKSR